MGSGAVAADHADAREAIQQGRNVIGLFLGDVLVQAARPDARGHHIPQPHPAPVEQRQAFPIWQGGIEPQKGPHDFPERVAGMGVILGLTQGFVPRQGTEHQHGTIRGDGRREGAFFHGWKRSGVLHTGMPAHFLHTHFLPEQGGQPRVASHGGGQVEPFRPGDARENDAPDPGFGHRPNSVTVRNIGRPERYLVPSVLHQDGQMAVFPAPDAVRPENFHKVSGAGLSPVLKVDAGPQSVHQDGQAGAIGVRPSPRPFPVMLSEAGDEGQPRAFGDNGPRLCRVPYLQRFQKEQIAGGGTEGGRGVTEKKNGTARAGVPAAGFFRQGLHGFPAGFVAAAVPELRKPGPQGLVPGSRP